MAVLMPLEKKSVRTRIRSNPESRTVKVSRLTMEIPARSHLIQRVQGALIPPCAPPLYLHGPPSTAKYSTLRAAAPEQAEITTIDCILNHTDRLLFSTIASTTVNKDRQGNPETSISVNDITTLIEVLRTSSASSSSNINECTPRQILYFTRAERLASTSSSSFTSTTLPLLFQLPRLCDRYDIRIVFSSLISFAIFRHNHSQAIDRIPISIYFKPLTENEIVLTLSLFYEKQEENKKDKQKLTIYKNFIKSVIEILYPISNNPFHLQRVIDNLFPEYLEKLMKHKNQPNAPIIAFNHIRDRLSHTLHSTSFIHNSDDSFIQPQQQQHNVNVNKNDKISNLSKSAKGLLIAIFLGNVIAPNFDMRHFSSERLKNRRRSSNLQKSSYNNPVPLERILSIYQSIYPFDDDYDYESNRENKIIQLSNEYGASNCISTSSFIHLSTLIALGWVSREVSKIPTDKLSEPKYRCRLSRDEIIQLAISINIHIHDYLVTQ